MFNPSVYLASNFLTAHVNGTVLLNDSSPMLCKLRCCSTPQFVGQSHVHRNENRQAFPLMAFSQTKNDSDLFWPSADGRLGAVHSQPCNAGVKADRGPATQGRPGMAIIARLVLSTGR